MYVCEAAKRFKGRRGELSHHHSEGKHADEKTHLTIDRSFSRTRYLTHTHINLRIQLCLLRSARYFVGTPNEARTWPRYARLLFFQTYISINLNLLDIFQRSSRSYIYIYIYPFARAAASIPKRP